MSILLTGANGFLGWHTRCRFHALTDRDVVPVTRENWSDLELLTQSASAVIHVAGVNRAEGRHVRDGNAALAQELGDALRASPEPPLIVYANSVQAGNQTAYGDGKSRASEILHEAAESCGSIFVDVRLPNLFGEHGRPNYNSFVATFIDALLNDRTPQITDRPIELLHAQDAAQVLMDSLLAEESCVIEPRGHHTSVQQVWNALRGMHRTYPDRGDIPPFTSAFDVALFNTYRAAAFPHAYPIALEPRSDPRGRLVETVRAHGGQGQSFVSTTVPGASRGDHYHLAKIERFAVLAGVARIALRRLFSDEVIEFHVNGDQPVAIDMPTMWTHNLTNTGRTELLTQFWTHELFDPDNPDTFWVAVDSEECSQ